MLTDGHENASREYTVSSLAELISRYQARPNWTFVFLSAAHDTVEDARDFAELLVLQPGERDALEPQRGLGAQEHALARKGGQTPALRNVAEERTALRRCRPDRGRLPRQLGRSVVSILPSTSSSWTTRSVTEPTARHVARASHTSTSARRTRHRRSDLRSICAGGFTSVPAVRNHGIRLRPRLYRNWGPYETREESRAAEARLAGRLRTRRFCVRGGH